MPDSPLFKIAAFVVAVVLIAALYWLTLYEPEDPCDETQSDVGAAVLADEPGDQEGLVNRAIIVKGPCGERGKPERNKSAEEQ